MTFKKGVIVRYADPFVDNYVYSIVIKRTIDMKFMVIDYYSDVISLPYVVSNYDVERMSLVTDVFRE
jgi:hypothetical protein